MTDDPSTPSGSRWEPGEAPAPPADDIHAPIAPIAPAEQPAERRPVGTSPFTKARLLLAAGAVALVGLGGAGGLAVGHAIASTGSGDSGGSSVVDRDSGPGGVPPGGFPGGTVPDQDRDTDSGAGTGTGSQT
jgi:hypothetical protein